MKFVSARTASVERNPHNPIAASTRSHGSPFNYRQAQSPPQTLSPIKQRFRCARSFMINKYLGLNFNVLLNQYRNSFPAARTQPQNLSTRRDHIEAFGFLDALVDPRMAEMFYFPFINLRKIQNLRLISSSSFIIFYPALLIQTSEETSIIIQI